MWQDCKTGKSLLLSLLLRKLQLLLIVLVMVVLRPLLSLKQNNVGDRPPIGQDRAYSSLYAWLARLKVSFYDIVPSSSGAPKKASIVSTTYQMGGSMLHGSLEEFEFPT